METYNLTNKTKRELIYLTTGFTINQGFDFEIRKKYFDSYAKDYFKMSPNEAIQHIDNMYNDEKLWDSLHSLNRIMREAGEGRLWMDRKTVENFRSILKSFLQEFSWKIEIKIQFTFQSVNGAETKSIISISSWKEVFHGFGDEKPLIGIDWNWELENYDTPKQLAESVIDSYHNFSIEEGNSELEYFGKCTGYQIL